MKNIYIIPTDKDTNLFIGDLSGALHFNHSIEKGNSINQNLYITSDEVIKKGDYWIYVCPINGIDYGDDNNPIVKNNLNSTWFEKLHDKNNYKKVILTTDSDLIQDGVQAIDDEFLEWFSSKNGNVNFVEVIVTEDEKSGLYNQEIEKAAQEYSHEKKHDTNLDKLLFPELIKEFTKYYENVTLIENNKEEMYSKQQTFELMKQAFEAGFKKADIVQAGLEPKETEQEVNWILMKHKNK